MKARVHVMLKNGVLDPQGEAVRHALGSLGFDGVEGVRQGKVIELDLFLGDAAADVERQFRCDAITDLRVGRVRLVVDQEVVATKCGVLLFNGPNREPCRRISTGRCRLTGNRVGCQRKRDVHAFFLMRPVQTGNKIEIANIARKLELVRNVFVGEAEALVATASK